MVDPRGWFEVLGSLEMPREMKSLDGYSSFLAINPGLVSYAKAAC
jgi:hypothetical protein